MGRKVTILFALMMLMGCNSNEVHSEHTSLPNQWPIDQTIEFTLPEMDSTARYNLFFNIRNTNEFKYNNLFVIAKIGFPNGKVIQDTLEYQMANPDGTWLGTGNRIKENKLWYKENIQFIEKGEYKVQIQHAMRNNATVVGVNELKGITDVGIIIENSQTER